MFSSVPSLHSITSPEGKLNHPTPASLRFWQEFLRLAVGEMVIVMTSFLFWSLFSKIRKALRGSCSLAPVMVTNEAADEELPLFDAVTWPWSLPNDDVRNVEDSYLQPVTVQEAPYVSLLPYQKSSYASSSAIQAAPTLPNSKIGEEFTKPSKIFCQICMENRKIRKMFTNNSCSHSFCYKCTTKHIVAKIQDNVSLITCPGLNCDVILDSSTCRLMIPKDVILKWDESLCKSLIQESQKVYCPFRDCSAVLVNDSGKLIKETKCPECKRPFCAQCNVPWHSEFSCKEFKKLNGRKRGRGVDVLAEKLAKKKKWRKCPRCKFYVEKKEGCSHITCRCMFQFCYKCGSKWSSRHRGCGTTPVAVRILLVKSEYFCTRMQDFWKSWK